MWNEHSTAGPLAIIAGIDTFTGGNGDQVHAYIARPAATGEKRPGLVLTMHMPGFDEFYFEFAERLARHGYDVICPDLYCRYGHGLPDDVFAKVRADGNLHDDSAVADLSAARDWLAALPTASGKIGILGSCSGGRHSLLTASLTPGFDAVIDMWGGGVVVPPEEATPARPVAPVEYTDQLNIPLLGLFGNEDKSPTAEQVDAHEARLKAAGKDYEFHRYDGAGHGFTYYHTPLYRQEQAMDAWGKIFAFFGEKLGS